MSDSDAGEKSEAPTGKRLEDARSEGQIAKSPEIMTAAFLIGSTITLSFAGPPLWRFLLDTMGHGLATASNLEYAGASAIPWLQTLGFRTLVAVIGLVGAMAVIAIAVQAAQTGGIISAKPMMPKFARINPLANAGRILGKQSFVELAKSLLKLSIVSWAVYATLSDAWPDIQGLALQNPYALMDIVRRYGIGLLRNAGMMFIVLAGCDYAWQRYSTMEKLKMTKQAVKEEHKAQEGDPEVKGRRRSIGRERIRRQMFAAVPKADVVIVNPVHIAIAIKYDPAVAPAPYVVAIGQRKIALRIKELAFQHGVPVIENKPLARALIVSARIGTVIPVEMYLAVAEVLAFVMRQRQRYGMAWRGTAAA
ncbi:MAG: EscU/YscU/HrcU family type III secretion system export apparatus switch protein [Gemmatimonadota bacterium]